METFSALLAICAGNSPVTGEFHTQRPMTRNFDIFFDLRLNKRLSKQSWGWWFETPSHHYDVTYITHYQTPFLFEIVNPNVNPNISHVWWLFGVRCSIIECLISLPSLTDECFRYLMYTSWCICNYTQPRNVSVFRPSLKILAWTWRQGTPLYEVEILG